MIANDVTHAPSPTEWFECRDIGYGIESGEVCASPIGPRDWTGKRAYMTTCNTVVYLFDDEVTR